MTAPTVRYRIEGAATLLSSLSHGGEHAGTTGFLRREKIVTSDGTVEEIPVVSGNSFRGLLRDHAADVMWRALGAPPLPTPVFHLLWSGGALAKAGSGHVLGARQLQQVRQLVPLVSLFGGSGAGKIIEGKLRVGKMMPICAETAHVVPDALAVGVRSIWELVQIEEFTRRDDTKRDQLHHAIDGLTPAELDGGAASAVTAVNDHSPAVEEVDGPAQQMRYGVETLAAGTRLHWWMSLHDVTPVETALLAQAIESWSAAGAAIGGRSSSGHGRVRLDVAAWQHASPAVTVGQALSVPDDRDPLAEHCEQHRDGILDVLGWFA